MSKPTKTTEPSAPALRAASFVMSAVWEKFRIGGDFGKKQVAEIVEEETCIGEIVAFLQELEKSPNHVPPWIMERAKALLDKAGVPLGD